MADESAGADDIRHLVRNARSASPAAADPDDPQVRAFAEFGLPADSRLAADDQLRNLTRWRDSLGIPANSAFLDGTLLLTVKALLGEAGPSALTPVTLWELATFVDALVCFDRLYYIANPYIDSRDFNRRLGANVLTEIPDPARGTLRQVAGNVAVQGLADMEALRAKVGANDVFGQEVQAVVDGWRAVLGPDFSGDGPFATERLGTRNLMLARRNADSGSPADVAVSSDPERVTFYGSSAVFVDDTSLDAGLGAGITRSHQVRTLIHATRLPVTPADSADRPALDDRLQLAVTATYRTHLNQGIANTLALPYLPGILRMPYRHFFVKRAADIQDELVSVDLANQVFARRQPSSPLTLPLFTSAVLQQAASREDVWAQLAWVRARSAPFRRRRAELDRVLERSLVSPAAVAAQQAMADEALKLADAAGATQRALSVSLGVVAQTSIVPLASSLQTVVDAAAGVGRDGSWARIWRRLFHHDQYVFTQANSQAVALTNALPQIRDLWELPKVGGYLDRFAAATQQAGEKLRTPALGSKAA